MSSLYRPSQGHPRPKSFNQLVRPPQVSRPVLTNWFSSDRPSVGAFSTKSLSQLVHPWCPHLGRPSLPSDADQLVDSSFRPPPVVFVQVLQTQSSQLVVMNQLVHRPPAAHPHPCPLPRLVYLFTTRPLPRPTFRPTGRRPSLDFLQVHQPTGSPRSTNWSYPGTDPLPPFALYKFISCSHHPTPSQPTG